MNREIKFRVWDKITKSFIKDINHGELCFLDFQLNIIGELIAVAPNEPEDYVPQQFTGLHDKNGKEIYEGDIVHYESPLLHDNEYYRDLLTSEVFWRIDRWRIRYAADSYNWRKMEVIGNIFENPELIKNEK